MRRRTLRAAALTAALSAAVTVAAPAAAQNGVSGPTPQSGALAKSKFTLRSALRIDLRDDFARLPLHRARVDGKTVWYVLTDVSDEGLARRVGLNHAPKLANLVTRQCPGCVQTIKTGRLLGRRTIERPGAPDFKPGRLLVPGPNGGFPPLASRPGAQGGIGYSPYIRIAGTDIVYNAPIVATGDGPFNVRRHDTTHDRLFRIDTRRRTVDMNFIRAFSHGKDIMYLSFESSSALTAVTDRSTFVPGLGLSPAPDRSDDPMSARSAIFAFTNGQRGRMSPPAQGQDHLIADGENAESLFPGNESLLRGLRNGGDAHNVLDSFPTLSDPAERRLYSPLWDVSITVWSPDAVARGLNVAQADANRIRQLAAEGQVTSPGGTPLRSDRSILNCPAIGFFNDPPTGDVVPPTPGQP